jgi:hypothetical protein
LGSTKVKVNRDYVLRAETFERWCAVNQVTWSTDQQLDLLLVTHLDEPFWKGRGPDDGSKLIARLKYFIRELKSPGVARLPRALNVLRSWRKRAPALMSLPMPIQVL